MSRSDSAEKSAGPNGKLSAVGKSEPGKTEPGSLIQHGLNTIYTIKLIRLAGIKARISVLIIDIVVVVSINTG